MEDLSRIESRPNLGEDTMEEWFGLPGRYLTPYVMPDGEGLSKNAMDISDADSFHTYTSEQGDYAVISTDDCDRLELTNILRKTIQQVLYWEKMIGYVSAFIPIRFSAMQYSVLAAAINTTNNAGRLNTYNTVRYSM